MKICKVIPNIVKPISTTLKKRAIKDYEKEMQEVVNDFLAIKPVPNNNLKKAYDRIIKQYSIQLYFFKDCSAIISGKAVDVK